MGQQQVGHHPWQPCAQCLPLSRGLGERGAGDCFGGRGAGRLAFSSSFCRRL